MLVKMPQAPFSRRCPSRFRVVEVNYTIKQEHGIEKIERIVTDTRYSSSHTDGRVPMELQHFALHNRLIERGSSGKRLQPFFFASLHPSVEVA